MGGRSANAILSSLVKSIYKGELSIFRSDCFNLKLYTTKLNYLERAVGVPSKGLGWEQLEGGVGNPDRGCIWRGLGVPRAGVGIRRESGCRLNGGCWRPFCLGILGDQRYQGRSVGAEYLEKRVREP